MLTRTSRSNAFIPGVAIYANASDPEWTTHFALLMNPPVLRELQSGNADAWDTAFRWLWPTAFAVARLKLEPFLADEIEDVAIETLEEMVEKVSEIKQVDELKPLTASIAHHRAVSRLRERFAKKRGEGKIERLDSPANHEGDNPEPVTENSPLNELHETELAGLLGQLQAELKPEQRAILSDFFLHGLTYEQIAKKHGMAIGSVGVYLKRGLEAARKAGTRQPKLLKELEAFLR